MNSMAAYEDRRTHFTLGECIVKVGPVLRSILISFLTSDSLYALVDPVNGSMIGVEHDNTLDYKTLEWFRRRQVRHL